MKKMTKIVALVLAMTMVVGMFAACGKKDNPETEPTETVATTEVTDTTGDDVNVDETGTPDVTEGTGGGDVEFTPSLIALNNLYRMSNLPFIVESRPILHDVPEELASFTGLDSAEGIKSVNVQEPMMGSQAYSLVLVELEDGVNAEEIAEKMKAGINPRKWVCVEADELEVATYKNFAMLIMMSSDLGDDVDAKTIANLFLEHADTDLFEQPAPVEIPDEATDATAVDATEMAPETEATAVDTDVEAGK